MVFSMTGYGRAQRTVGGRDITVEIRAVNHRYLEFSSRVPRAYGYLEEKLKGFVQASVGRGKVEAAVQIQAVEDLSDIIFFHFTHSNSNCPVYNW